jgi:hypothetical protein
VGALHRDRYPRFSAPTLSPRERRGPWLTPNFVCADEETVKASVFRDKARTKFTSFSRLGRF